MSLNQPVLFNDLDTNTDLSQPLTEHHVEEDLDVEDGWSKELRIYNESGNEVWEVPTKSPTRNLSHDYFRYIGKFPPQIPRQFINEYSDAGDLILDPMCGGGTTLIEARLLGRRGIGVDVNPVSRLISRTVTRAIDPDRLVPSVHQFLDALRQATTPQQSLAISSKRDVGATKKSPKSRDMHGHEKYFDEKTLAEIALFFDLLSHVEESDTHDFLLLGLLSVLRSISHANVKKMNLEMDLEKQTRKPMMEALPKKLQQMLQTNDLLCSEFRAPEPEILDREASDTGLPDESVDMAIIHPPYLTNTAFSEATQLQLAVLGISHLTIWRKELRARGSFLHEPNGVSKYIVGWNRILQEAFRTLKNGRYCAVVVGDGQVDYTRIPIGVITVELANDIGFVVERKASHRLNNNTGKTLSRKMRDQHIVVLKKP